MVARQQMIEVEAGHSVPVMVTEHGLTTSAPCMVHEKHIPHPHVNHIHHVWPLGKGGPDVAKNRIVVCPTGHYNLHSLLNEYELFRAEPPYSAIRRYGFKEREYAALGWDRMQRGAL